MDLKQHYKDEIENAYFDSKRKELLFVFLDEISKKNIDEISYLSFQDIANLINKSSFDNDTFAIINILESPQMSILTRRHVFIDDDGSEEEIDQGDFKQMVSEGVFVHPDTGEEVSDWKNHVFPFFTLSEKVRDLAE